jgi:flagellar motor switch protein FliM
VSNAKSCGIPPELPLSAHFLEVLLSRGLRALLMFIIVDMTFGGESKDQIARTFSDVSKPTVGKVFRGTIAGTGESVNSRASFLLLEVATTSF